MLRKYLRNTVSPWSRVQSAELFPTVYRVGSQVARLSLPKETPNLAHRSSWRTVRKSGHMKTCIRSSFPLERLVLPKSLSMPIFSRVAMVLLSSRMLNLLRKLSPSQMAKKSQRSSHLIMILRAKRNWWWLNMSQSKPVPANHRSALPIYTWRTSRRRRLSLVTTTCSSCSSHMVKSKTQSWWRMLTKSQRASDSSASRTGRMLKRQLMHSIRNEATVSRKKSPNCMSTSPRARSRDNLKSLRRLTSSRSRWCTWTWSSRT